MFVPPAKWTAPRLLCFSIVRHDEPENLSSLIEATEERATPEAELRVKAPQT